MRMRVHLFPMASALSPLSFYLAALQEILTGIWRVRLVISRAQIGIGAGIDFDLIAYIDKERNIDDGSGLQCGGLGAAGSGIAFDTGIGIGYFESDEIGYFRAEDFLVVFDDIDFHAIFEVLDGVSERGRRYTELIEGLRVIEDVLVVLADRDTALDGVAAPPARTSLRR